MKLAFRVDAGAHIGTGHLMRCLTLADAWRARGARTRFVARNLDSSLQRRVVEAGHEFTALPAPSSTAATPAMRPGEPAHAHWLGASPEEDAEQTLESLGPDTWDWLVVDHYAVDHRWQRRVRPAAARLMVIDDLGDRKHDCDLLLDQNLHANPASRYTGRVADTCRLLLGPRYALLRPEFLALRSSCRPRVGRVDRLLVFLGGVDADNCTAAVLAAITRLPVSPARVDVVIGATHPHREQIAARCAADGHRLHVQTPDLGALMAVADLAIGAGGSATWERCALGLPTLALRLADNQAELIVQASLAGIVHGPSIDPLDVEALARHLLALVESPSWREAISRQALSTVDANGTERIVRAMHGMHGIALTLRRATPNDSPDLLRWRNDETVRSMSHDRRPISPEGHHAWLQAVLADPARDLLIGELNGEPAAVLRFDIAGARALVSIYAVPGQAGRGAGAAALAEGERWLRRHRPGVEFVDAVVLAGNEASHALFKSAGFEAVAQRYQKRITS